MTEVSKRRAVPGDAERLADLRVAAMRPSPEAFGRFDALRARDRVLHAWILPGLPSPGSRYPNAILHGRCGVRVTVSLVTPMLLIKDNGMGRPPGARVFVASPAP